MAGSLVLRMIGAGFAFLVGIQLARYLGAEDYGIYAIYMVFVSLTAGLAQFGLAPLAMREIAKFAGSLTMTVQITWFVQRAVFIAAIICVLCGLFVVLFLSHSPLQDNAALVAALTLAFLISVSAVLGAVLRGAQHVLKGQLSEILITPALFSLFLLLFWSVSRGISPVNALLLQFVAALIAFLVSGWLTWRLYKSGQGGARHYWSSAGIPTAALPVWLSDIIRTINATYPLIVLAIFLSDEGTGIYKVAMSCAAVLSLPTAISNIAAGPFIAKIHASGDDVALQRLHALIGCILFGLMLAVTGVIWLVGADLIELAFGAQYRGATAPLLVLSICQVVTAFFGISLTFMIVAGGQRYVLYAYSISVAVAIYASTQLIPRYGVSGAAFADLLMVSGWHLFIWAICRRKYGYDLSLFGLVTSIRSRSPDRRSPGAV